jgi:hypothetical protein
LLSAMLTPAAVTVEMLAEGAVSWFGLKRRRRCDAVDIGYSLAGRGSSVLIWIET